MNRKKIKAVLFDLDGVLVDAKQIHYETLNESIKTIAGEQFIISQNEHLAIYDGLKTRQKLEILTCNKGLKRSLHDSIWNLKQELTVKSILTLLKDDSLIEVFSFLSSRGYKIACCSNSVRKTILISLSKIGVLEFVDLILSNEDVKNSKPHPEIYWKAMIKLDVLPEQCLIVEDSPHGLLSAYRSNSDILRVKEKKEVTIDKISKKIEEIERNIVNILPKWENKKMNILIPMAGAGSRFQNAGYLLPKPLIEVGGKPMIQVVVDNLNIDANYIYVVQKSHRKEYNLDSLLSLITPGCKIVETDTLTEGAACTALLAKEHINNNLPLFFANSDQFVVWDSNEFMYKMQETNVDGGIVTFKSTNPKWSFAKVNEQGYVVEVAEKNPISDIATVGFYYWKTGSDFVKYAERMIEKNIRVNNEFYVCPVFNQAIEDGKKIKTFDISEMWGLGTPEDLNNYLINFV